MDSTNTETFNKFKLFENEPLAIELVRKIDHYKPTVDKMLNDSTVEYKNVGTAREHLENLLRDVFHIGDDRNSDTFLEFYVECIILAYLQKFDNDKNLRKLKQEYADKKSKNEAEKKEIEEELSAIQNGESDASPKKLKDLQERLTACESGFNSSNNIDYMFGFQGLGDYIESAIEGVMTNIESGETVIGKVESNLLAESRPITLKEYMDGNYPLRDINVVALISNEAEVEKEEDVAKFLREDTNYKTIIADVVNQVMSTYKYAFQDSFGLRPYIGILDFSNPYLLIIGDANKVDFDAGRNDIVFFRSISERFRKYFGQAVSMERQFNIREMIETGEVKYYPYKMLEFVGGRCSTTKLEETIYRAHSKSASWEEYSESWIKGKIEKYIEDAVYLSVRKNYDYNSAGVASFEDPKFQTLFKKVLNNETDDEALDTYASMTKPALRAKVMEDLKVVTKSLCGVICVTSYNNLGGTINSAKFRVVDVNKTVSESLSTVLFKDLLTMNESVDYEDGYCITDGKTLMGKSDKLPYKIWEFAIDRDPTLSNAEPLFGYTAMEMFLRTGKQVDWNHILIGEDTKGTPLFGSLEGQDDLPFQGNFVHNMVAGSRSGKGVITMNMISSAMASEKPVFYIDRKPDMAVMFYELSQGSMFCINGAQYDGTNDPRGVFAMGSGAESDGAAIRGWRTGYNGLPSSVKEKIFNDENYYSTNTFLGDFFYMRAFMFCLGIIMARVEYSANPEIYNNLGGTTGVLVVADEFKNFVEFWDRPKFGPTGIFGNSNRVGNDASDKQDKLLDDLELARQELSMAESDPKAQKKVLSLQMKIKGLEKKLIKNVTECQLYCSQVMDKVLDSMTYCRGKKDASFKDSEGKLSDFFTIGQDIETPPLEEMYSKTGLGFSTKSEYKDKSICRGMISQFTNDWFMGYQGENGDAMKKYLRANEEGTKANRWIMKQMQWGYASGASIDSLKTSEIKDMVYFKPYLVLNNSNEDDPNNPRVMRGADGKVIMDKDGKTVPDPDFKFVSQCRDRVNKAVKGGTPLWEKVRLKHLAPELREDAQRDIDKHYGALNEGIGFEGLTKYAMRTVGKSFDNPVEVMGKSGIIANWVAQRCGYSDYKELIFDLSPDGIFGVGDIVTAIGDETYFQGKKNVRLPLYAEYGDSVSGGSGNNNDSQSETPYNSYATDTSDLGFDSDLMEKARNYEATQSGGGMPVGGGTAQFEGVSTPSGMSEQQAVLRRLYQEQYVDEPEVEEEFEPVEEDFLLSRSECRSMLSQIILDADARYNANLSVEERASMLEAFMNIAVEEGICSE